METTLTVGLTLLLTLCLNVPEAGGLMARTPIATQKRSSDSKAARCSYTFIVPQQKLTGALCLNTQSAAANQSEVSALRSELARQHDQLEKLKGQLEQEGSLAMEVRALRTDSNSMNSRIAQLYAQLLHEVIHKKNQALELSRVENLLLNATTQVSRPFAGRCNRYGILTSASLPRPCRCPVTTGSWRRNMKPSPPS